MNYNQYGHYPNYNYQQPYPQYTQYNQFPQTVYQQLAFVNGIEGAKAFIVSPNQTIYLMDSDSNTLFVKSADIQGKYTLKSFNLVSTEVSSATKQIPNDYVTKEDLVVFKNEILNVLKGVGSNE